MREILPGHIIVRRDGSKYFVGKTVKGLFLFSMEDGNRWTDTPIDTSTLGTTRETIEALNFRFGGFTVEGIKNCDVKPKSETTCNQFPCCNDVEKCEFMELPEITEKDLRLIVSDTLVHLNPNGTMGQMADKIAKNLYEYLQEISEEF